MITFETQTFSYAENNSDGVRLHTETLVLEHDKHGPSLNLYKLTVHPNGKETFYGVVGSRIPENGKIGRHMLAVKFFEDAKDFVAKSSICEAI